MIYLNSINLSETIVLPSESIWEDEFEWVNLKSSPYYSIQGNYYIEYAYALKGRPITLSGDNAVITRDILLTLLAWSNIPEHEMDLTLHDLRNFRVTFRNWDSPVVSGKALVGNNYAHQKDEHLYFLTLKLVEI